MWGGLKPVLGLGASERGSYVKLSQRHYGSCRSDNLEKTNEKFTLQPLSLILSLCNAATYSVPTERRQ